MTARARPRDAAAARPGSGAHPRRPAAYQRVLAVPDGAETATFAEPVLELESELAGRLDSVLGIAEKLAASHDRQALFRTIVDETRRALRVDYVTIRLLQDEHLHLAACAGIGAWAAASFIPPA